MIDRLDHGMVNLPLDKRGNGSLDAQIDRNLKRIAIEKEAERQAALNEYRDRNQPIPFTREELEAARAVRTLLGWYRVVRVNAKSVTVTTPHTWTDRVSIDKILEVKS